MSMMISAEVIEEAIIEQMLEPLEDEAQMLGGPARREIGGLRRLADTLGLPTTGDDLENKAKERMGWSEKVSKSYPHLYH